MPSKYVFELPPSKHSALSASAAHRWMACPGSVRLAAGVPSVTTPEAAEGTAAHYIAAKCEKDGGDADRWLGRTALVEGIEVEITRDVVDAINDFLVHCRASTDKTDDVYVERNLTPALSKLHPKLGGTGDRIVFKREARVLRVTDLKFGKGVVVEAAENKQLLTYALGALLLFEHLKPLRVEIEIAQPRIEHPDGRYRVWGFDTVDLIDFAADLVDAAKATEAADAPLVPGSKQCKFCQGAAMCPALEKQSHELVATQFDNLEALSPERISAALKLIPQIEARIEAIRAFAYAEAERGNTPPDFKLVEKRARRVWKSVEDVQRRLLHRPEYYTAPELKSPAQIETILGKKEFAKAVGDLVDKQSSGHTLVPVADPRPEVKLLTADAFENEDEKANG